MVVGMRRRRRGMSEIAVFGFGTVLAVDVHVATEGLSIGEATLTKCALVGAFSGVIIGVVFGMMMMVMLAWRRRGVIFVAGTVGGPLFSKIHAKLCGEERREWVKGGVEGGVFIQRAESGRTYRDKHKTSAFSIVAFMDVCERGLYGIEFAGEGFVFFK